MNKKCLIIGSGNSRQEGIDKGIHDLFKTEITFGLNDEFNFFEPTVIVFGDWTFFKCRREQLKNHSLIIGRFDGMFDKIDPKTQTNLCPSLPQLILLKSSSKYFGKESWQKGFFSGVLTGLFTLTLCIALGFEEIYLLGFDCQEINGKTHHYQNLSNFGHFENEEGKHRTGIGKVNNIYKTGVYNKSEKTLNLEFWNVYQQELDKIKIYNVSLNSKITAFPKISYDQLITILKNNPNNMNQNLVRTKLRNIIQQNVKNF